MNYYDNESMVKLSNDQITNEKYSEMSDLKKSKSKGKEYESIIQSDLH